MGKVAVGGPPGPPWEEGRKCALGSPMRQESQLYSPALLPAGLVKIAGNPSGIKIVVGWGVHLRGQVGRVGHG